VHKSKSYTTIENDHMIDVYLFFKRYRIKKKPTSVTPIVFIVFHNILIPLQLTEDTQVEIGSAVLECLQRECNEETGKYPYMQ